MTQSDSVPMGNVPAVATEHLTKVFGTRKAVDDVTFALEEGAFLSIFGPNGAGKTTLLRMLSTLARPSAGKAFRCGFDIREQADEVRSLIGMISHAPML